VHTLQVRNSAGTQAAACGSLRRRWQQTQQQQQQQQQPDRVSQLSNGRASMQQQL
jgi:hypothetical protein